MSEGGWCGEVMFAGELDEEVTCYVRCRFIKERERCKGKLLGVDVRYRLAVVM